MREDKRRGEGKRAVERRVRREDKRDEWSKRGERRKGERKEDEKKGRRGRGEQEGRRGEGRREGEDREGERRRRQGERREGGGLEGIGKIADIKPVLCANVKREEKGMVIVRDNSNKLARNNNATRCVIK